MPTPQSGWQPQLSEPQSAPGPFIRSVTCDITLDADSGNQSRIGSDDARLPLQVLGEVRQRVALPVPFLVADLLVAARERDGLERHETHLVAVLQRELHDRSDLIVVDRLDDRDDQADVDAGGVEVFNRAQLHVEQVPDLAVRVGRLGDAVELQIGDSQARLVGLVREVGSCANRMPLVAACTLK